MNFDRIVRTDIAADERGALATIRFDEEAIRDMAGKIDAELFDRIAAERGYLRQNVDVAALRKLEHRAIDAADDGYQPSCRYFGNHPKCKGCPAYKNDRSNCINAMCEDIAGRIREAVEGESIPEQVRDVAYCPRCYDDGFWRIAPADAEGFELLRCAGCGRDYRYKRPEKGGDAR